MSGEIGSACIQTFHPHPNLLKAHFIHRQLLHMSCLHLILFNNAHVDQIQER